MIGLQEDESEVHSFLEEVDEMGGMNRALYKSLMNRRISLHKVGVSSRKELVSIRSLFYVRRLQYKRFFPIPNLVVLMNLGINDNIFQTKFFAKMKSMFYQLKCFQLLGSTGTGHLIESEVPRRACHRPLEIPVVGRIIEQCLRDNRIPGNPTDDLEDITAVGGAEICNNDMPQILSGGAQILEKLPFVRQADGTETLDFEA